MARRFAVPVMTLALAMLTPGCTAPEKGTAGGSTRPVSTAPAAAPELQAIIDDLNSPAWTTPRVTVAYLLAHGDEEAGKVVTVFGDVSCSGHEDCRISDRPSCARAASPASLLLDTTKMPAGVFDYSGTRKTYVTGEFGLAGAPHIVVSEVSYLRC